MARFALGIVLVLVVVLDWFLRVCPIWRFDLAEVASQSSDLRAPRPTRTPRSSGAFLSDELRPQAIRRSNTAQNHSPRTYRGPLRRIGG